MLAPYDKELNRLKQQDPTLEKRIERAFDIAKKAGHGRYAFVEHGGNTLVIDSLSIDNSHARREEKSFWGRLFGV